MLERDLAFEARLRLTMARVVAANRHQAGGLSIASRALTTPRMTRSEIRPLSPDEAPGLVRARVMDISRARVIVCAPTAMASGSMSVRTSPLA